MLGVFLTVLPVFLLLAGGYGAVRAGYLPAGIADALNAYAVKLAVPALLFKAIAGLDFGEAFHPGMLAAFYAGALASFAAGLFGAHRLFGRRPGEAVAVGFSAMFSNTVLLGLPILERAFGHDALPPGYAIVALHAPLLYIVGIVAMEAMRRDGSTPGDAARAAAKAILGNALMFGILAGAAVNLSGMPLPEPVAAAVSMLAASAIPAALVGIGASLTRYRISDELPETLMVSALTLLLHPAIAFALAYWVFALPPAYVRAAVVIAAMPPGMNIYVFALMYDRAVSLSASAILVATALSVITVTAWLALLNAVLG
ncbi:MAG: AEC family transporter [Phyllobacteriaceae bacterium]|nr:AEC family transporter [Phyllobacteriaceae bacterium]